MKCWYWLVQTLLWPPASLLARLFYRAEIRGRENLKGIETPVVIVSNHRSVLDVFWVGISLPFASRFFPLRFMAETEKHNGPIMEFLRKIQFLRAVYLLGGGFPSGRGLGIERALEIPLQLLRKGESIVMFPEGKIVRANALGEFYNGASALTLKSGTPLLPFFIKIEGREIIIAIGKVFQLPTSNIEEGTSFLKAKIEDLRPH